MTDGPCPPTQLGEHGGFNLSAIVRRELSPPGAVCVVAARPPGARDDMFLVAVWITDELAAVRGESVEAIARATAAAVARDRIGRREFSFGWHYREIHGWDAERGRERRGEDAWLALHNVAATPPHLEQVEQ